MQYCWFSRHRDPPLLASWPAGKELRVFRLPAPPFADFFGSGPSLPGHDSIPDPRLP